MKKKLLLFISGLMLAVISPVKANAATISYGEASELATTRTIPLKIVVAVGDEVKNIKLTCNTGNADVKCSVKNDYETNENALEVGEITIGTLTIENTLTNQVSVKAKVSYTIDSEETKTIETDITLAAKAVQKQASSNSKFSSVKVSQGTMYPSFSPDVTEYTVANIADTINSVKFSYECDSGSDTGLRGGKSVSGTTVTLNQGENTITLGCVAEDGNSQTTYTFKVLRGDTGYNSARLKELNFEGYTLTPSFDKKTTEYTLTVPNKVNSLINAISYKAEDENANITTEGLDSFIVGENKLTIKIDNVNGDETVTYTVTVKRMGLEDIDITKYKDGKITFRDSEGVETTLDEAEFKTQYPDEYTKITNKEYKFDEEGNLVIEDKTKKEEVKKEEKKSNKTLIVVIIIIAGLLVIGVSGFFIFRKGKPSDNKKEDKKDAKTTEDTKQVEAVEEDKTEDSEEKTEEVSEEEDKRFEDTDTMNIDEALSDLMSTKQYDFKDKDE